MSAQRRGAAAETRLGSQCGMEDPQGSLSAAESRDRDGPLLSIEGWAALSGRMADSGGQDVRCRGRVGVAGWSVAGERSAESSSTGRLTAVEADGWPRRGAIAA